MWRQYLAVSNFQLIREVCTTLLRIDCPLISRWTANDPPSKTIGTGTVSKLGLVHTFSGGRGFAFAAVQ